MPRHKLLSGLLLLVVFANFGCQRHKISPPVLTGKLIIDAPCSHFVVQVLSGEIPDSSVLQKSWTKPGTDSVFTNVFTVKNVCDFAAELPLETIFTFTLNEPVPEELCYTCNIIPYAMPSVTNTVSNVQVVASGTH